MVSRYRQLVIAVGAIGIGAGVASASTGTVVASFAFDYGVFVNATQNFGGPPVAGGLETALFRGTRLDQPPGLGVDTTVPVNFDAYCAELGQFIQNPGTFTACPLLGSTTNPGGPSGPVLFDAVRYDRVSRLWGTFQAGINNTPDSGAFQLALWELCFDDDQTLSDPLGRFYVANDQTQPLTATAEAFLLAVRTGTANISANLVLLTSPDGQDIITTPTPGAAALLGLGALGAARRRRR
jgi:MYXO-CTERM domain-containing protein